MNVWIQSADFSTEEFQVDCDEACDLYQTHNWTAELVLQGTLSNDNKACCPPGIGFVSDEGHILHICPGEDEVLFHYHYPKEILGFFWKTQKSKTVEHYPKSSVAELIRKFYAQSWSEIENAGK